jgi:predicted Fe-Mo cluster-binding NifX family protein
LDISERLLIYDIDYGVVKEKEECRPAFDQPFQLISTLRANGIKTIVCGGCPQFLLRMLFSNGFEVLPGITGDPEHVVTMLADGTLDHGPPFIPFGGRRRNRGRGNKGRNRKDK